MGSVRRRKAEKGDERQQHGGKGTQETSVKWTSAGQQDIMLATEGQQSEVASTQVAVMQK